MQAELLKLKNNPLGLFLLAAGPLSVALVFALQDSPSIQIELATDLKNLWSVPMHLVMVLFLPYLLTLEQHLETEKWLWTAATPPWKMLLHKWILCVLISTLLGVLSMVVLWQGFDAAEFATQLATALSTSLTFSALSLALGSFAGVLTVSLVWSTICPSLLLLMPDKWQAPLQAALPGLELTDFAAGEAMGIRISAHLILLVVTCLLVRRKMPRW